MESVLHAVHHMPNDFLTRVLVRMVVTNTPTTTIIQSKAARHLGVDCLVNEKNDKRYPPLDGEDDATRILRAYMRHLLPIHEALVNSDQYDGVLCNVDPKFW